MPNGSMHHRRAKIRILQVLEHDASVISLNPGNVTMADVTDGQQIQPLCCSEITYTPPTGQERFEL